MITPIKLHSLSLSKSKTSTLESITSESGNNFSNATMNIPYASKMATGTPLCLIYSSLTVFMAAWLTDTGR